MKLNIATSFYRYNNYKFCVVYNFDGSLVPVYNYLYFEALSCAQFIRVIIKRLISDYGISKKSITIKRLEISHDFDYKIEVQGITRLLTSYLKINLS